MQLGRIILLGLAVLAGGGAILLVSAGDGNDGPALPIENVNSEMVDVLVANREFARGDHMSASGTSWKKWPVSALSDQFITSENENYRATIDQALARTMIVKGEPIFERKLVRREDGGILSALLTPGMRAISIDVSTSQGTSGFILPGDRVDLHFYAPAANVDERESSSVFSNLRVLAIDQSIEPGDSASTILGSTVTLEVHPAQVEQLLSKKEMGSANIALRSIFNPDGADDLGNEFMPASVKVIRYGQS